jgi:hypothetical protein
MVEFSPQQIGILERLIAQEFQIVAFPLYANVVGVRKGEYAALLNPMGGGSFDVFGEPCVLLDGNLAVRITEKGQSWFVWKKQRVQATPERLTELTRFVAELKLLLEPHV